MAMIPAIYEQIANITLPDGKTYSFKDNDAARADSGVPGGGKTGQVLTKNADGFGWSDSTGGGDVTCVIEGDTVTPAEIPYVTFIPDEQSEIPDTVNADTLGGRPAEDYELKTDHKWKKLGDYVGAVTVNISGITATADEVLFIVTDAPISGFHHVVSLDIPTVALGAVSRRIMGGWDTGLCYFDATNASAVLGYMSINSTNITASTAWAIYYR